MSGAEADRCRVCDRVGSNCPTLEVLVRATVSQSEARHVALAAMKDCHANRHDWRSRCLAAEMTVIAAEAERDHLRGERDALARQLRRREKRGARRNGDLGRKVAAMAPVVAAAEAWRDCSSSNTGSDLQAAVDAYRARGK